MTAGRVVHSFVRELFARKAVISPTAVKSQTGRSPVDMRDYTLLMFDWDDSVGSVLTVRRKSDGGALHIADVLMRSRPRLAGYQLWQQGQRVAATFPATHEQLGRSALSAIA